VLCKEAIMHWLRTVWLAVVVLSSALAWPAWAEDAPPLRHLRVNGVELSYLDQGTGAPVVFVHGSFLDLRFWEPQRQAMTQPYRFIAYNRRYHGPAAWPDAGTDYSAATHAADLAAFLRQLQAGPVHLVGHSYGGLLATLVAIEHPELLRSVTLAEPGMGSLLTDMPEGKRVLDDRSQAMAPAGEAAKAGDAVQATKLLFDWVANQGAGAFDTQPEAVRQMILDNARTVPLLLAAPAPPAVSCATLSGVKAPTLVIGGDQTPRYFSLINEVIVRCIPGSRLVTIPQAAHPMSLQNPAAFNEALLPFLAQH
jgi:pimeloyl-ACP methyl ester carboxylesterase